MEQKMPIRSWRSLRESNPSFQIENFANSEVLSRVRHFGGAKTTSPFSMAYGAIAKRRVLMRSSRACAGGGGPHSNAVGYFDESGKHDRGGERANDWEDTPQV